MKLCVDKTDHKRELVSNFNKVKIFGKRAFKKFKESKQGYRRENFYFCYVKNISIRPNGFFLTIVYEEITEGDLENARREVGLLYPTRR